PVPDEKYVAYLPDGSERKGNLDDKGIARLEDIPPGKVKIDFPDLELGSVELNPEEQNK
ncbi:MAG: hypothetical protein JRJ85_23435, partial [Deltaproteobacteria bacterium]|nr:hypothetical protein [Deltaproteobacteria bacterium]